MKSALLKFTFLIFLSFASLAQTTVMTYNLRFDTENDKENWWGHRKEAVVDLINYYEPDFLGVQEAVANQVAFLDKNLVGYAYIGVGRDDGKTKGEFSAIYYDSTRFELQGYNTFWLSETPEKVSVGWDASMERVCTYGIFLDKVSKEGLAVFNTHFDHLGPAAREQSAALIVEMIEKNTAENSKVVLMGDLNALPDSKPIVKLNAELEQAYLIAETKPYGPFSTFSGFNADLHPGKRIDYIFTRNMEVLKYRHIGDKRKNGLWPSDHLPVMAVLK